MRDAARSKVDRLGLVRDVCGSPTFEAPGTATEGQAFFILMEAARRDSRRRARCARDDRDCGTGHPPADASMPVAVMHVGPMAVRVLGFRMLMFVGMGHVRDPRVGVTVMKVAVDVGMRVRRAAGAYGHGRAFLRR